MLPRELVFALLWLAVHVVLLPWLIMTIPGLRDLDESWQNFLCYAVGALAMILLCWHFLRADFDRLCDGFPLVIHTIFRCYLIMFGLDLLLSAALSLLMNFGVDLEIVNQNNDAITAMNETGHGVTAAMAVFLAPILEETIFRGAIFGGLRRKNRVLAYAAGILLFGVYHVWPYAVADPSYWVYILQYVPVSFLLCFCYDKTGCIWANILFHASWNALNLKLLDIASEML